MKTVREIASIKCKTLVMILVAKWNFRTSDKGTTQHIMCSASFYGVLSG